MPIARFEMPDGRVGRFEVPEGTTPEQAHAMIAESMQGAKSNGQPSPSVENAPASKQLPISSQLLRQAGLTARYGIEGVGNVADMFAGPIRAGINAVVPDEYSARPSAANRLADMLNLPKPNTPTERIVGDASRMVAGAAAPIGLASLASKGATGLSKTIAQTFAANPGQQLASAGSAGAAGGYVREDGGDETSQLLASLAAGVATPLAMNKVQQAGKAIGNTVNRLTNQRPIIIDVQIDNALRDNGMRLADLPANIQAGIRNDVAQAFKMNGNLNPDAIRRLADYRITQTTPTAATLTLDPATVTRQKNLSKLGINSKDPIAQQLGMNENANNNRLISNLNEMGAGTPDSAVAGGRKIIGALSARNDMAKSLINSRYEAARAANGRSAALDPHAFTNKANDLLDEALLGGKLPADVRNLLNKAATGEMPLTVDVAEQLKTRIGDLQRSTTDMAERKALGLVRQSLDNTPLLDGQGQQAIDAFNKARRLNRAWMGIVDKTPALQAVRDGIEPDKFVQQFIVGNGGKANIADLEALKRSVRNDKQAMNAIKNQITSHLKNKALNGAADEVGNLSQSAYNKALNAIGDEKLTMFFKPEEVAQLKAIGRVASYEQFQPKGSAVNNSNTAGTAVANILDRIGGSPLLSKIPFGNALSQPAQNISVGIRSKQAMDVPNALISNLLPAQRKPSGMMLSPAIFATGEEDR